MAIAALAFAAAALATVQSAAQADDRTRIPRDLAGEGAWDRATFVPADDDASKRLREGDDAWAALAHPASAAELAPVFDAWRAAIARSASFAAVVPRASEIDRDVDGSLERRCEDVEIAVRRRLARLDAGELSAWTARFEPLAAESLRAAGATSSVLERVARDHPRTAAALRARLAAFDLAFERGAIESAEAALQRAQPDLSIAGDDERAAFRHRLEALAHARSARSIPASRLASANAFGEARAVDLSGETPAHGTRPIVAALEGGGFAAQSQGVVTFVRGSATSRFDPRAACEERGVTWPDASGSSAERPAVAARHVVVVAGRARGDDGNAIACVELGADLDARLAWARTQDFALPRESGRRAARGELGAGRIEFQPGPLIAGSLALVQLRERTGDDGSFQSACAAFDLETGELAWIRVLARGAPVEAAGRDLAAGPIDATVASPPLLQIGDGVAVATGLGVLALVAAADGRVEWSLRGRRRDTGDEGFDAALVATGSATFAWAASESDRIVYRLRASADVAGAGLFAGRPRRLHDALEVAAADSAHALVVVGMAGRDGLAEIDLDAGARSLAVPFAPRPGAGRAACVAGDRVAAVAAGELRLFDRRRELALLDSVRLSGADLADPAGLAELDGELVVATARRVWIVSLR